MSKMFVIAIDDDQQAMAFLRSVQNNKFIGYRTQVGDRVGMVRAPVLFMYLTDTEGKCTEHAVPDAEEDPGMDAPSVQRRPDHKRRRTVRRT